MEQHNGSGYHGPNSRQPVPEPKLVRSLKPLLVMPTSSYFITWRMLVIGIVLWFSCLAAIMLSFLR